MKRPSSRWSRSSASCPCSRGCPSGPFEPSPDRLIAERLEGRRRRRDHGTVCPVRRIFVTLSLGLFSFASLTACGSGAKDADKSDKSATKKQDPEPAAKQPEDPKPAPPEQVHFDIEKDKSGILARTASTLETSDRVSADNPVRSHLAELSHHSETGPSNEGLCTHIVELRSTEEPE